MLGSLPVCQAADQALTLPDYVYDVVRQMIEEEKLSNTETIELNHKTWALTFSDDFDGDTLDDSKWERCPEQERSDLGAYWSDSCSWLDGEGHLVINVRKQDGRYCSGAIQTQGKFEQAYGYFEIRCKLQSEPGFWTAFWLMGDTVGNVGNGSQDGVEIDIMEALKREDPVIHHNLHWDGYGVHHQTTGTDVTVPGIFDGYHTFGLEWNEEAYIFYVDGQETWRTTADGICTAPLFIIISAEVGTWGGDITQAALPDSMLVDYVKVYQEVKPV